MAGPVACTLGGAEHAEVRVRWQRLSADAEIARTADDERIEVRYEAAPGVLARLTELVELERGCCGYVDWTVYPGARELVLTVAGDAFAISTLDVP